MSKLTQIAEDMLGTPWESEGRGESIDCYGLVMRVLHKLGAAIPDFPYSLEEAQENPGIALDLLSEMTKKIPAPVPGCVVLFGRDSVPDHLGVMLEDDLFLHATCKMGVAASHVGEARYQSKLIGYYWVEGVMV